MTDKYTIKQISSAFNTVSIKQTHATSEELIAELTRPKWTPQKGEVYFSKSSKSYIRHTGVMGSNRRPLNTTEVPALGVAIEALEVYSMDVGASKALARIRTMIGENT
jgi:hypothetical protein